MREAVDLMLRRQVVCRLLGYEVDEHGFGRCPGEDLHSGKSGRRDFQILFDKVPTARCFHSSCAQVVANFNHEMRSAIWKEEHPAGEGKDGNGKAAGYGSPERPKPAAEPRPERVRPLPLDYAKARQFAERCDVLVDDEWLRECSPVEIPLENGGVDVGAVFLEFLYERGERVLIFTNERSQGQFLYEVGKGAVRLGRSRGAVPKESTLPVAGKNGVWFLVQPVTGEWLPNPNNKDEAGNARYGRRHGDCVTRWRYAVLESDVLPPDVWLRVLVQLPLSIVAVYTSGGRSYHALVRIDADSKQVFDLWRDKARRVLGPLGADTAAITAVRLSRFPGCIRYGKTDREGRYWEINEGRGALQELLYLAPNAPAMPIVDLVKMSVSRLPVK